MADAVTLAYVHGPEVAHSWHSSLTHLLFADIGNHARLTRGGVIPVPYSTGGISAARNNAAQVFLDRDHDWLWWVDTDMGFDPMTVEGLMSVADAKTRPVVGALCFRWIEEQPDGLNGYITKASPTVYRWHEGSDGRSGFTPWEDYPRDRVVGCAGTGSACILIHRSAFETIRSAEGDNWYTPLHHPTLGEVSEDLSFCLRLSRHGIPLHVHTGVKTSHLKRLWVTEQTYDGSPAVVAPTMNRAERRAASRARGGD